jgi:hypothetical protein
MSSKDAGSGSIRDAKPWGRVKPNEHPLGLLMRLVLTAAIVAIGVVLFHTWAVLAGAIAAGIQVAWERWRFHKTGWVRTPSPLPNESGIQQMRRERRERRERSTR